MTLKFALLGLAFSFPLLAQTPDPAIEQGKTLISSNQAEKAADLLEKAVAAKPNDPVRRYWLASAYGAIAQSGGMLKGASMAGKIRDQLQKAVELDPNYLDARFDLISFYLEAPGFMGGSKEKAQQEAAEIRKRDAFMGHRAFGEIAASKKDLKAARTEFIASVRENPTLPQSHYYYAAYLLLTEKDYKGSAEEFEAALRVDPNYMPAAFQVGHVAALSGTNLARGEEMLLKYLTYKPTGDDPGLHRAHYWLGVIYEKQGKKAEARAHYETSLRLWPGQKDVHESLKRVS